MSDRLAERDEVLALAVLGARLSRFHHDIASKLQGVMLSLDEATERAEALRDSELEQALATASVTLGELNQLLAASRAVVRPPSPMRTTVRELIATASDRTGVALVGEASDTELVCCVPQVVHALALVIDTAQGSERSRKLAVDVHVVGSNVELGFATVPPPPEAAAELLALAGWLLGQHGGSLRSEDRGVIASLPLSGIEHVRALARR
jgi:hypothetical protein